jgi:hypothetical protein
VAISIGRRSRWELQKTRAWRSERLPDEGLLAAHTWSG